jgi:acyl-CoA dehydrogenase
MLGREVQREIAALAVAEAAGGAGLCLERSLAYAKTRTQFGRLIGSRQAVKHHLANMHLAVELARSSALAVALADPGEIWPRAKLGFDYCAKVWETAIQVHGGIGFTWEGGLHYYAWQLQGLRVVAQSASKGGGDDAQPTSGTLR